MWTHPAIECLLTELRKRKMLYDQRHIDYLNRLKRTACLEAICKVLLEKEELKVSVDEVKAKIQVLRSQLNKELRYMSRSKKYKPKLWCFKKMEFLKPYCGMRSNPPYVPTVITNGHKKQSTVKSSTDQNESISSSPFDADVPSSSSVLMSKTLDVEAEPEPELGCETQRECYNGDIDQQFYDTIALTQQIVQSRIAAKERKAHNSSVASRKYSSWEGELVKSQLDLITDETIRSDTLWEIQCVLRRGIEQDRVLPKRRRNRKQSLAASEVSANGSCISLDSNDSACNDSAKPTPEEPDILIE